MLYVNLQQIFYHIFFGFYYLFKVFELKKKWSTKLFMHMHAFNFKAFIRNYLCWYVGKIVLIL